MLGDEAGSIPPSVTQCAEACNGRTFWHVETKKELRLTDELRAEIRSQIAVG